LLDMMVEQYMDPEALTFLPVAGPN
jgi:hypothetical protein